MPLARELREAKGIRTFWTNIGAYSDVSIREELLANSEKMRLQRVPLEKVVETFIAMLRETEGNRYQAEDYFDYIVINGHDPNDPKRIPFDVPKLKALGPEVLAAPLEDPTWYGHHEAEAFTEGVLKLEQIHRSGYRIEGGKLMKDSVSHDGGFRHQLEEKRHQLKLLFQGI